MSNEVITKRMDVTIKYFDLLAIQPDIAHWFRVLQQEVQSVEKNTNKLLIVNRESHNNNHFLASIQKEEQILLTICRTSWKSFQLECRLMHDTKKKKRYEEKRDRYEIRISHLKDLLEKSKNISEDSSWEVDDDSSSYRHSKGIDEKKSYSFETVSTQNDQVSCHMMNNLSQLRVNFNEKVNLAWEETNSSLVDVEKHWYNIRNKVVHAKRQVKCSQQNIFEERDDQGNSRSVAKSKIDPFITCLGDQNVKESWNEFWR